MISSVIFYAGINLGFLSSSNSQLNKAIWIDACFHTISAKFVDQTYNLNLIPNPEINQIEKTQNSLKKENDLLVDVSGFSGVPVFEVPFPSDSGEESFDSTEVILDSLGLVQDSLSLITDSIKVDQSKIDSTNRLKYFRYTREDKAYVEIDPKKKSKFFIQPSASLKRRTIELDSSGHYVIISEKIGSQEAKIAQRIPLEDYIYMQLAIRERQNWEEIGYAYELKAGTVGLSELITSFTDFEIPLPSVGVLSIFGEPKISLKIGGAVQIHGAWRSETTEGVTASRLGNTRNEPDFKQTVQINVNGTIGDKLNISADWNTERTFEYENQLKIKYTGYEDEIIQSIEAGNVSMQTSSLIGGAEALFGVKALFKLGPFSLTTIASQKKGETKEVAVSSGSTSSEFEIRPYDYSENHYFVDEQFADNDIFSGYFFNTTPQANSELQINDIEVWKSINIPSYGANERLANCYIDLPPLPPGETRYPDSLREAFENPTPGREETGRFLLLTENEYTLHPATGFITFKTAINTDEIIAVSYKQGTNDITYGEFIATTQDTFIVLKLIKPKNLKPGGAYAEAWKLRLKNIYPTGSRNIKKEGFEFKINYELVGQEPTDELPGPSGSVRLLESFGLDQQGAGGNPNPDNVFDWRPPFTIFPETGEIVFPNLQPFGENIPPEFDSLKYQSVYDTTKIFARQDKAPDKWVMVGKNTGDVTSVYQLGFNVVENSVKVLLNGSELTPNVDYIVDYNIGQLTIRNDAALIPGADLRITYEQNDLFQLASKTLLGARGLYKFSDKTQLGFTVMNLNQQTLSDKVRIGEEPLSNTIYGADFKTAADLPILTSLLDNVISTKEISVFTFSGEYAYMSPDPNTKKSTIASDEGKSIAYIDDFEGAKRTIPIGVGYGGWKDLSAPENLPFLPGLTRQDRMRFKAKSFWYNVTPSDVVVDSIFGGRRQVARADQQITVLDYVFIPDTPGTNNTDPDILLNPMQNWGGTQRLLSSTANNLTEQNIEFFEFWLNIPEAPPNASMYIDLGLISEDVIPNNELDTEDKNRNFAIDEGEDTGIDGRLDDDERSFYGSTRGDPSNDNFFYQQSSPPNIFDYFNINGTQGNAVLTDIGLLPDTEDLNGNGSVDYFNSYFRYQIPLDTMRSINPFIAGGGFTSSGWYLIRVPLKDTVSTEGSPSFSNVEAVRIFVQGVTEPIHIRLTEFNLVGNQWQKLITEDSVLSVSVVSLEENPDYTSPPGVFRERDRTRPDEEIFSNEQSLNLVLRDLPDGENRDAVKYLFRPLDVFNYSEMKLFIHGDENFDSLGSISYVDQITGQYSSEVYFRFGTDTSNYYEYRQPVVHNLEAGSNGWTSISILFDELTAIKAAGVDSTGFIKVPVEGKPGHFYQVRGNPTLTSVKFLTVGIYNRDDGFNPGPLSGEVWVNELRVIGADDSPGWAYSFSTSMKFADLMTVNFNMSEKNPYFHRLSERFGSRVESRNWAIQTDLDVLKLVPFKMKDSNLRLNFSHTESIGKPLYIPGTDIRVDEAVKQLENNPDTTTSGPLKTPEQLRTETESINISNSISSSNIKLKIPTDAWYIRDSWNALTFGFNYNNTFSRSPSIAVGKSWVWNGTVNYAINFSPDLFIKPADIPVIGFIFQIFKDYKDLKINFTPQNFAATVSARRNRNSTLTRARGNIPTNENVARDFTAARGFNFGWKITEGGLINLSSNYNLSVNSSLAYLLEDENGNDRSESDIWNEILGGAYFGKDYQYQQSVDFRTSPKLPSLWDINRYLTLTASYSVGYRWDFDLRQEEIGRRAGYNRKFTAGTILRWKSLTEPLFISEDDKKNISGNQSGGKNNLEEGETSAQSDSTESVVVEKPKTPTLTRALEFLKIAVKAVFFDWENFTVNFSHDQSLAKTGIKATGTGFANFWGLTQNAESGPGRGFQLGFDDDVGPRAFTENTNLTDVFSKRNTVDLKTARPLWEGAKLDINWNVGWAENKNTTLRSDAFGNIVITNVTSTGNLNRTFLSLPSGFLPFVDTGIKKVNALYNPNAEDPRQSLSNAFVEGFETLPFLSTLPLFKDIAKYIPRPNWRISWDGVEKLLFFKSLAERISLDHAYGSTYSEGWKLTREGNRELQNQRIEYGFSPLIGLNITFGELWGGNLTGNIKFSSRTGYDLGVTTTNITETFTKDIGFTAGFSKSGFEMPLFGISLKNDIEFLFSYTSSRNSTIRYEMDKFTEEGIPQDGTTRTTIEPRIKYTISSKVTLAIFYKRSTVEPEGAARIPPTTTNEAGLDVNIVIQ